MKVIFHKLFPYAPYLNEYIGVEMDFQDNLDQDVFDSCVDRLRELTESNHKKKYPHLYNGTTQLTDFNTGKPGTASDILDPHEVLRLQKLINGATTPEELENYYNDAEKYGLTGAWDKKLKELKNK